MEIVSLMESEAEQLLRRLVAGLSLRTPAFDSRTVHVTFVMERVAMGQAFLQ
jgi:hypothetical protein